MPFVFETGAKVRACYIFCEPRGDSACDEDTAPSTGHQSNISRKRPQHRAKEVEGRSRNWASTIQRCVRNIGGIALRGSNSFAGDDSGALGAGDKAGDTKAGPRSKHRHWSPQYGLTTSHLIQICSCEDR